MRAHKLEVKRATVSSLISLYMRALSAKLRGGECTTSIWRAKWLAIKRNNNEQCTWLKLRV